MLKSKHILCRNGIPRSAAAILIMVLLNACASTTPVDSTAPSTPIETSTGAAALMAQAARVPADRAAALYLQAAWAYLEDVQPLPPDMGETARPDNNTDPDYTDPGLNDPGNTGPDYAGAERAYAQLEPGWLDEEMLPDYQLLTAVLAIHRGDLNEASAAMGLVPNEYRLSARAQRISSALRAAEGDFDSALHQSVAAAGDDPSANEQIWQLLNRSMSLPASDQHPISDDEKLRHLPGWYSLHDATVRPFSRAASREAVSAWLDAHADHPAALIPPSTISRLLVDEPASTHVALLLPLSGPLARAGESVRDGFISASLSASSAGWLTISIYDSAAEPLPVLYERILADGADLLVGPLQKPAVTALSDLNPELPVLALNYLERDVVPAAGFYQFGLAIEDEARTIARRLEADGISRALLFHNYDDWSLRARRTLTDEAHGSQLNLTVAPFTDLRTITESVGSAMHVAGSKTRKDELASLLGEELEFLPRARQDVDAVIALIDNTEANALVPALRFHFADHLPIYASSQTTRRARTGQLTELRGFHVSELPYFLAGNQVYAVLADPFDLTNSPFASLMALGSDAYRLTERLDLDVTLLGSTGLLRRKADGRVVRELDWGTISDGEVQGVSARARASGAGD
jgi:outer membrane PBP1 activator LpoA protein